MKVLFCGGGTAGHVYPNIAIAETLEKNIASIKFAYAVTEKGIENQLISFEKHKISVIGINKGKIFTGLKFIEKMVTSIKESKRIITAFNPDLIIGTGGFATFPIVYAGHKMGIKTVLHESNSTPGRAIKSLERKADLILVNYEETKKYFKQKNKVKRVGNPLRKEFIDRSDDDSLTIDKSKKVILSIGGSLGAKRLNDAVLALVDNYLKYQENIVLFFVTGKKDYARVNKLLKIKGNNDNIRVLDFCCNIPEIMKRADLVISRAGAMTISELAYSKKCSILIPSPNVANNHQYKNAKLLSDKDGAVLIKEDELYYLTDKVKYLIENESARKNYERNIGKFSVQDANKKICMEILNLFNI